MKKFITVFISLLLLFLTSCSNQVTVNGTNDIVDAEETASGQRIATPDVQPEKIILTLGILQGEQDLDLSATVARFNHTNESYHIEIYDYAESTNDIEKGRLRMQAEMLAGAGPDIVYDANNELSVQKYLLDLYPYIDADPELSCDDLLPSVLLAMEEPGGVLPMIASAFVVDTMVGTVESMGHIEKWTPSAMLALINENPDMPHPFGSSSIGIGFLCTILLCDTNLLSLDEYEINLESEPFYDLLEASKCYGDSYENGRHISYYDALWRTAHGEHLAVPFMITSAESFLIVSQVFGENLLALGYPTTGGGKHTLFFPRLLGINMYSEHPDGAWEFLRAFLLSDYKSWNEELPVRTDLFAKRVGFASTPQYEVDADGNAVEIPLFDLPVSFNGETYDVEFFAMTERSAEVLQSIVGSAKGYENLSIVQHIYELLSYDYAAYYNGSKTVSETSLVMQKRIQLYLDEQQP